MDEDEREIDAADSVVALRCFGSLRPMDRPPHEDMPDGVMADLRVVVNMRSWIEWCVLGLWLLSGGVTLRQAIAETVRLLAVLTMRRVGGNTTYAAQRLDVSRRVVRKAISARRDPVGTRVVVIQRVEGDAVYVFGPGVLVGYERPPNGTRTRIGTVGEQWASSFMVPKLVLDDGQVVWGPQCKGWLTEAEFEAEHRHRKVVIVPLR